jgi:hypothetical protein
MLIVFYFESLLNVLFDCALSLYELYDTIVALRSTFLFILVNPLIWWFTVSHCYA